MDDLISLPGVGAYTARAVAAFSVGVVPRQISGVSRSARARHYLAAGTLEPAAGATLIAVSPTPTSASA